MQSAFCTNCRQPLPAGSAFCANCGASQQPANHNAPTQMTPPPPPLAAAAPSPGANYAPAPLQPPPASPPPYAPYAGSAGPGGMYPPASSPQRQMPPPPPAYAPGPPPVVTPGGAVAPWAQPPKKRRGGLIAGILVALVLVVALLGGGFLLLKSLSSKSGTTTHQPTRTPGAGNTPGSTATSGSNPSGTQTLDNINRQAIYAGVPITIQSAKEAASLPEYQERDPTKNALAVQAQISNQTPRSVYPTITALAPDGIIYSLASATPATFSIAWSNGIMASGEWFFDVPQTSKVGDFQIQFGSTQEAPVTVPLTGNYDPTQWQQVTHQINQTVTYDNGQIKGTVTQVVVGLWTPGYQAPKDMRLLLMYLHVTNNTAGSINVGNQYLLVFPNGDRSQRTTIYGALIDVVLAGGESKDVGYDTFLIPTAPAAYVMIFLNPDGSTAGQVNLGTI